MNKGRTGLTPNHLRNGDNAVPPFETRLCRQITFRRSKIPFRVGKVFPEMAAACCTRVYPGELEVVAFRSMSTESSDTTSHTPEPRCRRAESGQKGALEEFSSSNDIDTDAA